MVKYRKLRIYSKPDINQSKLTVCSVLDKYSVTTHQDQLIQDKPTPPEPQTADS